AGRYFTAQDTPDAAPVVMVNETFARRMFPGETTVGKFIVSTVRGIGPLGLNLMNPPSPAPAPGAPPMPTRPPARYEIVGGVSDVKNVPLSQPTEPAVYFTARQFPFRAMFLAVSAGDTATATAAIQAALRQIAPGIPVADVKTWAERFSTRTGEPRLLMTVLV